MDEYMRELYAAKVLVSKLVALLVIFIGWLDGNKLPNGIEYHFL